MSGRFGKRFSWPSREPDPRLEEAFQRALDPSLTPDEELKIRQGLANAGIPLVSSPVLRAIPTTPLTPEEQQLHDAISAGLDVDQTLARLSISRAQYQKLMRSLLDKFDVEEVDDDPSAES